MKKTLITLCLAALALPSPADEESLVVYMADGSGQQAFALEDMGKLLFDGDVFTVNTGGGTSTFKYDAVRSIKFTGLSTGIGTVTDDGSQARLYYAGGCVGVNGWTQGRKARAAVYSIDGTAVITVDNYDGSPINVGALSRGIYIFSVDNNNIKFAKQ